MGQLCLYPFILRHFATIGQSLGVLSNIMMLFLPPHNRVALTLPIIFRFIYSSTVFSTALSLSVKPRRQYTSSPEDGNRSSFRSIVLSSF
jgi:hypothetical protein